MSQEFNECCVITEGRCKYEVDGKCTSICGDERPYGDPLCEIEPNLKLKNEEEFKITKEGLEKFLLEFSNAIDKNKRRKL